MSMQWKGGLNFAGVEQALAAAADRAVQAAAEHVLEESSPLVPTESGRLRDSGVATSERQGGQSVGAVAYTAVHAVRQHEDLDDVHDDGQAKFLEQPLNDAADQVGRIVAAEIRRELT